MIAYVFWHRPAAGTDPDEYEARLRAFHERLRSAPPAGFRDSVAFRVDDLPWLGGEPGYEDWYRIEDWAALGALNDAAIDAAHRPDHDAVAGLTRTGAGAVYKHVEGELELATAGDADWSHKSPGPGPDPGREALWQRQLVLGPAPEFCLFRRGSKRVSVLSRPAST